MMMIMIIMIMMMMMMMITIIIIIRPIIIIYILYIYIYIFFFWGGGSVFKALWEPSLPILIFIIVRAIHTYSRDSGNAEIVSVSNFSWKFSRKSWLFQGNFG